ncbi:MAG: hypothetical protein KJ888_20915 [Gammaproteobacteria bacterium]|nr:hypothetical protein [Gammaproteobacteria bacterium]
MTRRDDEFFTELFGIVEDAFTQGEADDVVLAATHTEPEPYGLEPVATYKQAVYYRLTNGGEPVCCRICGKDDRWQLYTHPDGHHAAYYCPHRLRRCPIVAMDSVSLNTRRPPLWRGAGIVLEDLLAQVSYRPGQADYPGDPEVIPFTREYR